MKVEIVDYLPYSVDVPEDIKEVERFIGKM